MADKLVVHLDGTVGVIVPCESGVVWSNQAGGYACAHPKIEGIFVPFGQWQQTHWNTDVERFPLENVWEEGNYSWELVKVALEQAELDHWFEPVMKEWAGEWGEAWIPVKIKTGPQFAWLSIEPFQGKTVILVMANSD